MVGVCMAVGACMVVGLWGWGCAWQGVCGRGSVHGEGVHGRWSMHGRGMHAGETATEAGSMQYAFLFLNVFTEFAEFKICY